jgi:hypothetical protein
LGHRDGDAAIIVHDALDVDAKEVFDVAFVFEQERIISKILDQLVNDRIVICKNAAIVCEEAD